MPNSISLRDRQLVEKLMRVWNDCYDSELIRSKISFPEFGHSANDILLRFGMEWDPLHGYIFPWTNRETGPFPMTSDEDKPPSSG